jgi:hypothetical protein
MKFGTIEIKFRPADSSDVPFVFSTWLRSYKFDSPATGSIRQDIFFKNHQTTLERIFARPAVQVIVACNKDDPTSILGYIAFETNEVLHFCYVRRNWRVEDALRNALLDEAKISHDLDNCQFSHYMNWMIDARRAGQMKGLYNPYLAYL